MTALAALWRLDGRDDGLRDLARMLASQQAYGADDRRAWSEGPVALGRCLHRALPEDRFDRQPLIGADGRLALVADIRLDNREELVAALGLPLATLGTRCDAALLLDCLERWGEHAVDRLVGDFAFICWDARERRLWLARDYRGMRPLHFHRAAGFVAVATMPKGLHALAEVPRGPDLSVSAEMLVLMPRDGTASFWEGIERVPPATLLTIDARGMRARRYWQAPPAAPRQPRRDWAEGLRHHLDTAVAAAMRGSEGALGSHLSAGYDSAGVTATAARLLAAGARLSAFTAVPAPGHAPAPRGRLADESALAAAAAAQHPAIDHVLVRGSDRSPFTTLDRDFHLFETPLLNRCNMGWVTAILDEAKRRGVRVLLTGEMGNMTLSYGGSEYLPQLLAQGCLPALAATAGALVASGALSWRSAAGATLAPFLPEWLMRALGRPGTDPQAYSAIAGRAVAAHDLDAKAAARAFDPRYRGWIDGHAMRAWVIGRSDPGTYYKGYVAGWGIDQRDPTGDRRLADYCFTIPPAEFVAGGQLRSVARRALADRLPAVVLDARAKGQQAADWHLGLAAGRDEMREELARLRRTPSAAALVDLDRLETLDAAWPDGNWSGEGVAARYRYALLRGISVGHFVRKASGGNG